MKERKVDKMNREELEKKLQEVLRGFDSDELVSVWNEFIMADNRYDNQIYHMDELDEMYSSAEEAIRRAFYGYDDYGTDKHEESFNPNRDYFYYNAYGNLVSVEYVEYNEYADRYTCSIIDEDALVAYMIDNETGFDVDDLEAVFEEMEEE